MNGTAGSVEPQSARQNLG